MRCGIADACLTWAVLAEHTLAEGEMLHEFSRAFELHETSLPVALEGIESLGTVHSVSFSPGPITTHLLRTCILVTTVNNNKKKDAKLWNAPNLSLAEILRSIKSLLTSSELLPAVQACYTGMLDVLYKSQVGLQKTVMNEQSLRAIGTRTLHRKDALSQLLDQLAAARTGRFVGGAARNNLDIKAWSSGMWGTVAVPDHLLSQFFRNISRERSVPFPKSRSVPIHVCATKCKPGGPMIRSSGKPSGMKIVINATCASTHAHMQTCMHMLVCAIVCFHECMSASMCASIHACSSPGPHVYADSVPLSGIAYCKMDGHAPLLTGKRHYPKFNSSTKVGIHARAHT